MLKIIKKFCEQTEKQFLKTLDQLDKKEKYNFTLVQNYYRNNSKQKTLSQKQQIDCLNTIRSVNLITLTPQQTFQTLQFIAQQKIQNYLFSECQSKMTMCIQNLMNGKYLDEKRPFDKQFKVYMDIFYAMGSCLIECEEILKKFEQFLLQKSKDELEWFFVSQNKTEDLFCIIWYYNKIGVLQNYQKLFTILLQIVFKNYNAFLKSYFDILKILFTNNLDEKWNLEKQILKTLFVQIKNFEEADNRHYTYKKSSSFLTIYLNLFPQLALEDYNGPFDLKYVLDEKKTNKYDSLKTQMRKLYEKSKLMIEQQKLIKGFSPLYYEYRKAVFFLSVRPVIEPKQNETEQKLFSKIEQYFAERYANFVARYKFQFFQYEYDFVMQVEGVVIVMELNGFQHYLRSVYYSQKDKDFKFNVSNTLDRVQIDKENHMRNFGVNLYYNLKWTHYMGRKQSQETLDNNLEQLLQKIENDLKEKLQKQLIKIYDTLDEDQKKLHDSLFNIYKDNSILEQSNVQSSKKFRNFVWPQQKQSENLQLDILVQTNNKLQQQNEQLQKQNLQKEQNIVEVQSSTTDLKIMNSMFKEMIQPFIQEIQDLKNDLKNLQIQQKQQSLQIDTQGNNVLQKRKIKDSQEKVCYSSNHQQIIDTNYQKAVDDINQKVQEIQGKLKKISNFDQQIIQIEINQEQELLQTIHEQLTKKLNFKLPLNELEDFDYKKFQQENNNILQQIKDQRQIFMNSQEDIQQYENYDKIAKKIKKEKTEKIQSILDIYKQKFGKRYQKFLQNRKPVLKINHLKNIDFNKKATNFQIKKNLQNIQSKPEQCDDDIEFQKVVINNSNVFYNPDEELNKLKQDIKNHENDFLKTLKLEKEIIEKNQENTKLLKKNTCQQNIIEQHLQKQEKDIQRTNKKKHIEFDIPNQQQLNQKYSASKIFDLDKQEIKSAKSENFQNLSHITIQRPQSLLLDFEDIKNMSKLKDVSAKKEDIFKVQLKFLILMQVEQQEIQEPQKHDLDTIEKVNKSNDSKEQNNQSAERKRYRNPFNIFMAENKDNFKNFGSNYLKEVAEVWKSASDDKNQIKKNKSIFNIQKNMECQKELQKKVKKQNLLFKNQKQSQQRIHKQKINIVNKVQILCVQQLRNFQKCQQMIQML